MGPCVLPCVEVRFVRACIHGDPVRVHAWGLGASTDGDPACLRGGPGACVRGGDPVCGGIWHVRVCVGVRRAHGDPAGTDNFLPPCHWPRGCRRIDPADQLINTR